MSCCKSKTIKDRLDKIKSKYPEAELYNDDFKKYQSLVDKKRTSYYTTLYITNILRFLQIISSLGISILTTNNNPYFVDYEEVINIYLWYLAIFSTCINMLLEFFSNKYNVNNQKIILDLLKGESKKLLNAYCPYDNKNYPNNSNKIIYFSRCIELMETNSIDTLIEGLTRPPRRSTPPILTNENNSLNNGDNQNNRNQNNNLFRRNSILPIDSDQLINNRNLIINNFTNEQNNNQNNNQDNNQNNNQDNNQDNNPDNSLNNNNSQTDNNNEIQESDDEDNWSFFKKWF